MNLSTILLIVGVILLLLAAFGAAVPHVSLLALGLAFCFASFLPRRATP